MFIHAYTRRLLALVAIESHQIRHHDQRQRDGDPVCPLPLIETIPRPRSNHVLHSEFNVPANMTAEDLED
jgi:hypothetical protein